MFRRTLSRNDFLDEEDTGHHGSMSDFIHSGNYLRGPKGTGMEKGKEKGKGKMWPRGAHDKSNAAFAVASSSSEGALTSSAGGPLGGRSALSPRPSTRRSEGVRSPFSPRSPRSSTVPSPGGRPPLSPRSPRSSTVPSLAERPPLSPRSRGGRPPRMQSTRRTKEIKKARDEEANLQHAVYAYLDRVYKRNSAREIQSPISSDSFSLSDSSGAET